MKNYSSLEDIFSDEDFETLAESVRKKETVVLDPEVDKFRNLMKWIEDNGREPEKSRKDLKERSFHSFLKGIREDETRKEKLRKYDDLNLLGE